MGYQSEWTGFRYSGDDGYPEWRTLWDWMQLFIVPLVLAVVAVLFSRAESATTRRTERNRSAQNRSLSEIQQQENLLNDYINRLSDLLLKHELRESNENAEVRDAARAMTLNVVRRLNGVRKGFVVRTIADAGLHQVLDLSDISLATADLQGADLRKFLLCDSDISRADLRHADLSGAVVDGAEVSSSDLQNSNLTEVRLDNAKLNLCILSGCKAEAASFVGAELRGAQLDRTNLLGADFSNADMFSADLSGADLRGCNFSGADLRGANLSGAQCGDVNFEGADLFSADITSTDISRAQLMRAFRWGETFRDLRLECGRPIPIAEHKEALVRGYRN